MSPSRSSFRRISSSLCIASCLFTGVPATTLAQTNPGHAFIWGGDDRPVEPPLDYVLEYGTPGHPQDRYRLKLGRQKIAIEKIWISYPKNYDSEFSEKSITLQEEPKDRFIEFSKSKKIPVTSIKVDNDKVTRLIKIVPKTPIVGEKAEIVLSNVQNPRSSGRYKFDCHVFVPGNVPLKKHLGTWRIVISPRNQVHPRNQVLDFFLDFFSSSLVLPICIIFISFTVVLIYRNRLRS